MKIFFVIAFCHLAGFIQAQEKKNIVYGELLGNGFLGSVNYERQLGHKPKLFSRVGVGILGTKQTNITIPVGLHYLLKNKKASFWDFGIGATYTRSTFVELYSMVELREEVETGTIISIVPSVGFRKHTERGLFWRMSFTPVITKDIFLPYIGFSIGKLFN